MPDTSQGRGRSDRRRRVGLALCGALSLGCSPREAPADEGEHGVTWTQCQRPVAAEAKCGVVRVEEKRAAPNGRTVELALVVVPATARTPAPDPVFVLAGGPGQGAASLAALILRPLAPLGAERDLVFVDLRGTGASNPLRCDEPDDLAKLLAAVPEPELIERCVERHAGEAKVDLTQYTSEVMVEDLEAVREALGYEQINLFGVSYGTALAQVYMREHGEVVRSAVLDGPVPIDRRISLAMPRHMEAALMALLRDCREDEACAQAYPGLERKLAAVLDELEHNKVLETVHHPRTGEALELELSRQGFISTLGGTLYASAMTSLVPLIIERAHRGDYDPLAAVALRMAKTSDSISTGLYLSVACAEDLDTLSPETRAEAVAGLEFFDDYALEHLEQACALWPHAELDGFHEPVTAATPTLLLSGAYDPVTPPDYGDQLEASLANARHVSVASASHGVWHVGCAARVMASFFAAPDPASVDASCLDAVARPGVFLNPNGPWPLALGEGEASAALAEGGAP